MKRNSIPDPSEATESLEPFLRLPAVLKITGLSRSTLYRMVAEHTFPAPVKLSRRAVAWNQHPVRQWAIGRPTTSR
jgi:prophage regulatory protein